MLDSEPAAGYQSPDPFSSTHRSHFRLITAIGAFQKAFGFSFLSQKGCLHSSSIFSHTKSHSALACVPLFTYCLPLLHLSVPPPSHTICYQSTWLPLSSGCRYTPQQLSHDQLKTLSTHPSSMGAFPALHPTALCPPVKLLTVPLQELSSG